MVAPIGLRGAPSALDPQSPQARHISGLWWLMFGAGRRRLRDRRPASSSSPSSAAATTCSERFGHRLILFGGVLVPVAILAVVAVFTVRTTNALVAGPAALQIHVAGEQWWWRVTYPDLGITTANEIHVPVGKTVDVTLTSDNVIHSFWVPQLAGKTDLIPARRTTSPSPPTRRHLPRAVRRVLRPRARPDGVPGRGRTTRPPSTTGSAASA